MRFLEHLTQYNHPKKPANDDDDPSTQSMGEEEIAKYLNAEKGVLLSDSDPDLNFEEAPSKQKESNLAPNSSIVETVKNSKKKELHQREVCKYDAQGCSRKNIQHFIDYDHPSKKTVKKAKME